MENIEYFTPLEQISTRLVCNKFQDLERTVIQDLKQILQDNQKGQHIQTTLVFASPNDKLRNQSIEGKASITSNSSNGSQSRLMFARQDKLTSGSFNFATPSKRTPSSYLEVNQNGKGMIPQKRKYEEISHSHDKRSNSKQFQNETSKRKITDYGMLTPQKSQRFSDDVMSTNSATSSIRSPSSFMIEDNQQISTQMNPPQRRQNALLYMPSRDQSLLRNIRRTQQESASILAQLRSFN